ncbi:IS3 family transposase [Luteimonas notoginsengisoli]
MARSRKLTYAQAARILRTLELGGTGVAAAKEYGVTPATISLWRPYIGLDEEWLLRVKELERTRKKLRRRLALARLQVKIAASLFRQLEPNPRRRALFATAIRSQHPICRHRANEILGLTTAGTIKPVRQGDAALIATMRAYLTENPGEGFPKMFRILLQGSGCTRFHAEMLYRQARLTKHFRNRTTRLPGPCDRRVRVTGAPDSTWSIDFLVDALSDGRRYWVLNGVDEFNRECIFTKVLARASTRAVVHELEAARLAGRVPAKIRSDNGAEFKGLEYLRWASRHGARLAYARPGHPIDNVCVERVHRTMRAEVFNCYRFESIEQVQWQLDYWRIRYNLVRPHMSLGMMSPVQYAQLARLGRG